MFPVSFCVDRAGGASKVSFKTHEDGRNCLFSGHVWTSNVVGLLKKSCSLRRGRVGMKVVAATRPELIL